MRVNVEDDLDKSGRLERFAREMRWSNDRALGRLVRVWGATQDAEIITASREEIVRVTLVRAKDREEAERVVDALIASHLADENNGLITIHGNEKHVTRLVSMRKTASAGGSSRAAGKRLANGCFAPAENQPSSKRAPAPSSAPGSLLLIPPAAPSDLIQPGVCDAASDLRAPAASLALEKFYLEGLAKKPNGSLRTRLTPNERVELNQIAGGVSEPRAVVAKFLADEREHYQARKWALSCLVRDLSQHASGETQAESLIDFLKRKGAENG